MNLGRRRIKNEELCALFAELGFDEVEAFLASGNVIFEGERAREASLGRRLEKGLNAGLGYEVPTFLRRTRDLRDVVSWEPFSEVAAETEGRHQVALLRAQPSPAQVSRALACADDENHLALCGRELHCLPKRGLSDSQLDWRPIEAEIGDMTMRTRRTIERIVARYDT
jgi:uncharacterized protein (DUF1697 family)